MTRAHSITRRLVATVLVLELLAAVALICAVTIHEWSVQVRVFDSSLMATAQSLMGAVQDREDEGDNVMLDTRGVQLARDAVFRVQDERGTVLGAAGNAPEIEKSATELSTFFDAIVNRRRYRFIVLHGVRIVDPEKPKGGVRHDITIVYGTPSRHIWHEVIEALRFFAVATALLLGITATMMVWLVRKSLSPVHAIASEAQRITATSWHFQTPESAKDIVELRPLTTALEDALQRLERSFQQQRRFTSDAAHELKTDVAIIKSSLQLLSMRKRTPEEYSQGLQLTLQDCTRLEMTVQKLLTLARLEQPQTEPESAALSCSLRDVVFDNVQQCKPLAEMKSVHFQIDFPSEVQVRLDRHDAQLLCSNLLLNALQHSPEGTTVTISASADRDWVSFAVEDQGEGIPENMRADVFEPFYRGDPSRSRKSGGTGLGLSICRAISRRAGGSIEISDSSEGGALVEVSLPVARSPVPSMLSSSLKPVEP